MKIVLTRLDRLGDLILSTPTIRAMRRSFPQAHLTLICSERNRVAVEHNPDLDSHFALENERDFAYLAKECRGADIAIALAPRMPDLRFIVATKARRRIGYTYVRRYAARVYAHFALTDALVSSADPALCDRNPARPVLHEVDQLLLLAARAGANISAPELVIVPTAQDHARVVAYPPGAIHLHLAPRWLANGSSEASFLQLLHDLRVYARPIVVSFAAECAAVAGRVILSGLADAVVGDLAFAEWTALMAKAACVLTVDTSATHVASAMKRPTIVLFEHEYFSLNSREWAPWHVPSVVIRKPPSSEPAALAASRQELVAAVGRLLPT